MSASFPTSRSHRLVLPLAALLLAPALCFGQNKDRSYEVGATFTFTRFDVQSNMQNDISGSLLFGYNFTKRHGGEIVFTTGGQADAEKSKTAFKVDYDVLRLGYTYNAYPREKTVTFFRAGIGMMSFDPGDNIGAPERLQSSDNNFMVYGGAGIRWFITHRLAIRVAATADFIDAFNGILNPDINATGDLGVIFLIGGREPGEKPAEEAPPADGQQKPDDKKPPKEKPPEGQKPPDEPKPPRD
ncbi:MAG TPA: outer membrane beta-barrel protein [Candidatus Polarisedimenticolia bacterium]|nr:outer membrane beta-barrel protein [Candidatus Polarisedimenticolia bacterium]